MSKKINPKYEKYLDGLRSLAIFGFDLIIIQKDDLFGNMKFTYQAHSYFDGEKTNLPSPLIIGDLKLSNTFMYHYEIKTEVDIARYLRYISILLTNFKGPKETDNLNVHIERLQDFFSNQHPFNESIIAEPMRAYDEVYGNKRFFDLNEYVTFAHILDKYHKIFDKYRKKPLPTGDYDEMFAYRFFFKDFTEEKMKKMLNDQRQYETLINTLIKFKLTQYNKRELETLVKRKDKFDEFFKILKDWSYQTFTLEGKQ